MKKNAFTLVEIVVSLVVLAGISILIIASLKGNTKKQEENKYNEYVGQVTSAADVYLNKNTTLISALETNKGFVIITIKELTEEGLLTDDLINPNTGEKINETERVMASLDSSGLIKFTYPASETEEHLQTLNKELVYGGSFDCLADLDTINLGLIDSSGNLVSNYFTDNPTRISCNITTLNTSQVGTFPVEYEYTIRSEADLTASGATKRATRNFIVIDNIPPKVENISATPTTWTNGNVTITAEIWDEESSIKAYSINKDSCGTFIDSSERNITGTATSNGTWYICAKDAYENLTEKTINITNIDKTPPTCTTSGGSSSWINASSNPGTRTIIGTCSDTGGSACVGNVQNVYSTNINTTTAGPGGNNVASQVCDNAGNCTSCQANQTVKIDKAAPGTPTITKNKTGTASFTITAGTDTGGSGLSTNPIRYCLGSGCTPNLTYTGAIAISSTTTIRAYTIDNAGNKSSIATSTMTVSNACSSPYSWDGTTCKQTTSSRENRQEYNCPSGYSPSSWTTYSPSSCTQTTSSRDSKRIYGCSSPYSPTYESESTYTCSKSVAANKTCSGTCSYSNGQCKKTCTGSFRISTTRSNNGCSGNCDAPCSSNSSAILGCSYSRGTYSCSASGSATCRADKQGCTTGAAPWSCNISTTCTASGTTTVGCGTPSNTCTGVGGTLSGSYCIQSQTSPLKRTEYKCPSGYSPSSWSTSSPSTCSKTTSSRDNRTTYSCPSGYSPSSWSTSSPSTCSKTTSPSCSSGYTHLNGKCYS